MSIGLVLPALLVVSFGTAAGVVRWPVRPAVATRLLTGIAAVAAATVLLVLTVGATGLLARSAPAMSLVDLVPSGPAPAPSQLP